MATSTKLVLGRGEVYFDRFSLGTNRGEGERYVGNTTAFDLRRRLNVIDRYGSTNGVRGVISSEVIEDGYEGQFTTDHIDLGNVSIWFGGQSDFDITKPLVPITEQFTVKKERWYQLGKSYNNVGVRDVRNVLAEKNGVAIDLNNSILLDNERGRIFVPIDSALSDGDEISVSFSWGMNYCHAFTANVRLIEGSLRFIAKNVVGDNRDLFLPHVSVKPANNYSLKGDSWQTLSFDIETLKTGSDPVIYILTPIASEYISDEAAILLAGVDVNTFRSLDHILDKKVNFTIPTRGYDA